MIVSETLISRLQIPLIDQLIFYNHNLVNGKHDVLRNFQRKTEIRMLFQSTQKCHSLDI